MLKQVSNIRVRLVLWTVAVEALLLLIFAGVFVLVQQDAKNREIDELLQLGASQLNAVVDFNNGQYLIPQDERTYLQSRGLLAWLLTPDQRVVATLGTASSTNLPEPPALNSLLDIHLAGGDPIRLLAAPWSEGDQVLGTVLIGLSLRDSQALVTQTLLGLGITIPFVLALSAAGGLFLASRALSPVTTITRTVEQISAEDLTRRLDLDLPDDEIGHLARTFDAMLDRLERAFERERQLTADASHELRTPLGLLKTQLSLARSRPRNIPTLLHMLTDMESDVDRMTSLVEQMLTLARVEQQGQLIYAPFRLDTLLETVAAQFGFAANQRQITLTLDIPTQVDWQMIGDVDKLHQVFANIVDNAVKYTPAGGKVTVAARRQWDAFQVTVTDTGPGIPTEHLSHVFERFYRADSARSRSTGGFGLGLALAQALVQAHHGHIEVASELGTGTTFSVVLPADIPDGHCE